MKYFITIFLIINLAFFCFCQSAKDHFQKGKDILNHANITGTEEGDYQLTKAVEEFTKAIESDPNYIEAYRQRGLTKIMLNDYRGAIKDYSKIIKIKPNDVNALSFRAQAYNFSKRYNKALQDYNKAIELSKDKSGLAELYLSMGSVRLNLNQKEKACEDFSKAGELGNSGAYDMMRKYCN